MFFASCSDKYNECDTLYPALPEAAISIVDNDGNSLIGEDNLYKPSEISLTREEQNIPLDFFENDGKMIIFFYYGEIQEGTDYFLKLNSEETDVINLDLRIDEGVCFDILKIETFLYNNQEIHSDMGSIYTVHK